MQDSVLFTSHLARRNRCWVDGSPLFKVLGGGGGGIGTHASQRPSPYSSVSVSLVWFSYKICDLMSKAFRWHKITNIAIQ